MEIIKVYSITENTDKIEGRGASVDTGIYFKSESVALNFVNSERYKKYSVMGVLGEYGRYDVKEKILYIYGSLIDFDRNNPIAEKDRIKERALNAKGEARR